jgi:RimJ/RimL family protein N-acetyltransferase
MGNCLWPLADLTLRTPMLELRWPSQDDMYALAGLAARGVHDPGTQPFVVPWTDAPPAERARSLLQHHWSNWGSWQPADWRLGLVAVRDGAVVGVQSVAGREFAVAREVSTGSWVGHSYHGQGIGTHMRAAALHLAFEGLGAEHARSEAFADNHASLAVSRKLGYRPDGIDHFAVRGRQVVSQRLRLTRAGWEAARTVPVEICGLAPCLPLFGLAP